MGMKRTPLYERIASKTRQQGECVIWTGRMNRDRPVVDVPGASEKNVRTLMLEAAGKPVPAGMTPLAGCERLGCICAAHAVLVPLKVGLKAGPEAQRLARPVAELQPSRLPSHLKYCTAVNSVWALAAA